MFSFFILHFRLNIQNLTNDSLEPNLLSTKNKLLIVTFPFRGFNTTVGWTRLMIAIKNTQLYTSYYFFTT